MKTQSEEWFENYCANAGLDCKRIPEQTSKTPDYELTIDGNRVIVEVKEILRNASERESDRLLAERGYGNVLSQTPGDRVRKKIQDASPQIKSRTQDAYPSILVLCELHQIGGHLDPYNIRAAMYGLEQVHIAVPEDLSVRPYTTGMSFGPKRKMTPADHTSISGVGVLFWTGPSEIALHVYHNKYAAIPLSPVLLGKYGIRQYALHDDMPGRTAKWEELFPTR